jgi:transposase-like protein
MMLALFGRKSYILGKILVKTASYKELAMPEQSQDLLPLTALPPQERDRALERYRILQPCVEHDAPLKRVAHQHGIPLRTAARWLAQYRRYGLGPVKI